MFTRVLFPTDCSSRARSVVALIAGMEPRPEQACAVVVVPISGMEQPLIEAHIEQAMDGLEELVFPLKERGISVLTRVLTGRPVQAILRTAEETGSDGIVLGSYGKDPMQEVLKGSLSAELTRHAEIPVLSVRFGALWGKAAEECAQMGRKLFTRPLHPTDMSECSKRALDTVAQELVGRAHHVDLVHVIDDVYQSGEVHDQEIADAASYMEQAASRLAEQGVKSESHLIEGDPVADITRLSFELESSCIVLGSRGKGLVREAVVGSVSQGILRMASKPVLVLH